MVTTPGWQGGRHDAAELARREALKRERGKWTVPVEARGTDCDRTGDEYECAVALSVPALTVGKRS